MGHTIERYDDLAAHVLRQPPRLGPVRLVAVDGPAGSGKTTFAGRLAAALTTAGATVAVIHTDDLLEGWTDMVSFWPRLDEWVLRPLRRGEAGRYRAYDWINGRFSPDWHQVPVPEVLIVEGVTSARAQIRPHLALGVFVTAPAELRLRRGIDRDGEALRPQWLRWMADEDLHFTQDATVRGADRIIDGAPDLPHDPEREYIRSRLDAALDPEDHPRREQSSDRGQP